MFKIIEVILDFLDLILPLVKYFILGKFLKQKSTKYYKHV